MMNDFPSLIPPLTRWEKSLNWGWISRRVRGAVAILQDTSPTSLVLWGAALATITALIVEAFYLNHPLPDTNPDTASYLNVARDILTRGQLVHTDRTPGFPLLIVLVGFLTGGTNLTAVSVVHAVLFVLATVETYVIAVLLFRRAWVGFLLGLLVGADVSELAFIKPILTEGFSLFEVMSLVLVVVLFIRQTRILTLWIVTALSLILFMTRPEWIYFPVPLFAYLMIVAARRAELRRLLPHAAAGLILLYAVLGSYVYVNATQNDYSGVTEVQNVNLLGKVMQYHMQTEAPSEYASVAETVDTYVNEGVHNPYVLLTDKPVYQEHHYALVGAYATAVIEGHPVQFAADTLPLMVTTMAVFDNPESVIDPTGPFALPLLRLQTIFVRGVHLWNTTFVLLALAWLALALLVQGIRPAWRTHPQVEMFGVIALFGLYGLFLGSAGSYESYSRMHAPFDPLIVLISWGSLLVGLLVAVPYLRSRFQQPAPAEQLVPAEPSASSAQPGPEPASLPLELGPIGRSPAP